MSDQKWLDIGSVTGFTADGHQCFNIGHLSLVVLRVGDRWYAIENRCPHAGLPLGEGERRGMTLTCPYHGYTYHIGTGRNIDFPDVDPPVRTFPVRVELGRLQVRVPSDIHPQDQP
ncbi:MAG: hypothetical protein Kow00105_00710 [Phycisphaeraceae bacterium]